MLRKMQITVTLILSFNVWFFFYFPPLYIFFFSELGVLLKWHPDCLNLLFGIVGKCERC